MHTDSPVQTVAQALARTVAVFRKDPPISTRGKAMTGSKSMPWPRPGLGACPPWACAVATA